MRKQQLVFLAFVVMLLGIPVDAQAEDFCSSLNRVIADAPNNFRTNEQLAGFDCSPLGTKLYVCSKPTQDDIIANVKKCLPGWHISLNTDRVLMLRTEDVGITVSVNRSELVDGKPVTSVAVDKRRR